MGIGLRDGSLSFLTSATPALKAIAGTGRFTRHSSVSDLKLWVGKRGALCSIIAQSKSVLYWWALGFTGSQTVACRTLSILLKRPRQDTYSAHLVILVSGYNIRGDVSFQVIVWRWPVDCFRATSVHGDALTPGVTLEWNFISI